MTSALTISRYGLLALFVSVGVPGILGVSGILDARAQEDDAAHAETDQNDVPLVNRGKMRLGLLLSLVKNELQAASLQKTQLIAEQDALRREQAELSAAGDQRRPADNVRLEQIAGRLEMLDREIAAVDSKLPQINGELDGLQRRLDEANGIVRDDETAEDAVAQENGTVDPETSSASIWLDDKRRIQEALVYFGGYNAVIDGDFGPRTSQAIKVYQQRQSLKETGVLTTVQEGALLSAARDQRILYGVEALHNEEFGYWLAYPTLLLSEMEKVSATERRMVTTDGKGELLITIIDGSENLNALYEDATAEYEIQYQRKRDNWFVVAGLIEKDRIIYDTVRRAKEKLVRARLSYPADQRDIWTPFAVIMFNTFNILPTS